MKSITMREIANDLKLSVSTVSRALANDHQIGTKTKRKVQDYARQKSYTVNRFAQGLRVGKSRTIGVVVSTINDPMVIQMLEGIYDFCEANHFQFLIKQSKGSLKEEQVAVQKLYSNGVDGLLISPTADTVDFSYLGDLQKRNFPIVVFDQITDQLAVHQVGLDHMDAAYRGMKHLLDSGMRQIAVMNGRPSHFLTRERLKGCIKALKEQQMVYDPELVSFYNHTDQEVQVLKLEVIISDLFLNNKKADALFIAVDALTVKILEIIKRLGVSVPIVGFSDRESFNLLTADLAVLQQPAYEIGKQATKQLLRLIEKPKQKEFEAVYLKASLHALPQKVLI